MITSSCSLSKKLQSGSEPDSSYSDSDSSYARLSRASKTASKAGWTEQVVVTSYHRRVTLAKAKEHHHTRLRSTGIMRQEDATLLSCNAHANDDDDGVQIVPSI